MEALPSPRLALAAACALLLAACQSSGPSAKERKEMIALHTEMAMGYYALGDLERASDQAMKGLELDPKNDQLRLVLGWTLQRKDKPVDVLRAEKVFRELQHTKDFRAVLGLAEALERKGQAYAEARTALREEATADSPADPARMAQLEQDSRKAWEESLETYLRTLELHPDDRDAINGLQRVSALLERFDESLHWSETLLAATAEERTFWSKRLDEADVSAQQEARLRELLERDRELEIATRLHVAGVLRKLGRPEEAVEQLGAVIDLDPARYDAFGRRAQVLMDLGRYREAMDDIDAFLRLTPEAFDHPDTRLAFQLRSVCQAALAGTPEAH